MDGKPKQRMVLKLASMPILTCKRVMFYSHADEAAFFHFAESVQAVRRVEGVGDSILLYVSSRPSQQSLRDLIALFLRYRIPGMSQLASFLTDENCAWFGDPQTDWHRKVFGAEQNHPPKGPHRVSSSGAGVRRTPNSIRTPATGGGH